MTKRPVFSNYAARLPLSCDFWLLFLQLTGISVAAQVRKRWAFRIRPCVRRISTYGADVPNEAYGKWLTWPLFDPFRCPRAVEVALRGGGQRCRPAKIEK